ncbi:MAG: ATP-binding protein [candidate division Zixibacteria bacterium]|nr:ATP-binding protein [candidate division Zixibacteria bacterium]
MTFTGKIRVYLVTVALLPPLIVLLAVYFLSERQLEFSDRQLAFDSLEKYRRFEHSFRLGLRDQVLEIISTHRFQEALILIRKGRAAQVSVGSGLSGLDFLEILDADSRVLTSSHRPGLIGEIIRIGPGLPAPGEMLRLETLEYDVAGRHAAFTCIVPMDTSLSVYCGSYIDHDLTSLLSILTSATVDVQFEDDLSDTYTGMDKNQLYEVSGGYRALLAGGSADGFYLVADFVAGQSQPLFSSLLLITSVVGVSSVLIALALGFFITGRAKREIDNLRNASARIADGDFNTPVMAYEEGEFSELADSLTDTMIKLRALRKMLATSEKIAAWQTVGRKIAHEIKNPLTPIAISAADLHRSFLENRPEFQAILTETTTTIQTEVRRLTALLDQFVSFARMAPPRMSAVNTEKFFNDLQALYRHEIEKGRLKLSHSSTVRSLQIDPEQIKQVLVNLVKNSFETAPETIVSIAIGDDPAGIRLVVEDNGPGFTEEQLKQSFEPYFSTKKTGSGLGLVICQRIVFDHGGTITLYNRPEGGAGVRIIIP